MTDISKRGKLRRDHPCCACFIDETGAIAKDRFFGVGALKLDEPARVLRAIQKYRDQRHWYKEFKFSDVTKDTLELYKGVIDRCFESQDMSFFCFMADRSVADPIERFGSPWIAYAKLAEQLVIAALKPQQLASIMADNYSTPDSILFEEDLRSTINRRLRRLSIVSVVRLDSRSSDGLQTVDLLTSATAFEWRASAGLASKNNAKAHLAAYVRKALGADSCLGGWRSERHSVAVYTHGRWEPTPDQPRLDK